MEKITALHRNFFGEIISFVTSSGRVISYQKAVQEAENGWIDGIEIKEDADGNAFLIPTTAESFDEYPNLF
ncbi:DUF3892 domain-containing protein [Neobacillus sp. SM06]|uniref:DUF3892 domain-containing protein n=1 Tax=Neobacillus sp. SM06 TaxID=3422492 RepID=UPI003D2AF00C